MKLKRITAMLAGTMIGMSVFTVPVFANTGKESECICEDHCTEDEVNPDCPVCTKDISLCQGKEKAEKEASLTPDGNMNLVDDLGKHKSTGKQFLTITSKSGKFFYIIIDRDDIGNETVHFLNQVDEADLLDLMNDEDIETYQKAKESVSEEPEVMIPEVTSEPKVTEEKKDKVTEEKTSKTPYAIGLIVVCGLLGAGGTAFFIVNRKKKKAADNYVDPDADYDEMADIDLPEEEGENVTFEEDNSDSDDSNNE